MHYCYFVWLPNYAVVRPRLVRRLCETIYCYLRHSHALGLMPRAQMPSVRGYALFPFRAAGARLVRLFCLGGLEVSYFCPGVDVSIL